MPLSIVLDAAHEELTRLVAKARVSVWISTANLKSTLVEAPIGSRARARGKYISFFETLADLAKNGVEVRVLHAGEPSRPLAADLARLSAIPMRRCPRVHLKMIAVDGSSLYLGSANLTGAGIGSKGENRRNFELGILTDDTAMLDVTQARFDRIWRGAECKGCALRRVCPKPIDMIARAKPRARARR